MMRTQVYIPDIVYSELALLAKRENQTISQLIREGAAQVIARKKRLAPKGWGKGFIGAWKKAGRTDAVAAVGDLYRSFLP